MGLKESFDFLARSPYIRDLATLVRLTISVFMLSEESALFAPVQHGSDSAGTQDAFAVRASYMRLQPAFT